MLHFIFHVILLVICMSVLDCINWGGKKRVTGLKKCLMISKEVTERSFCMFFLTDFIL